MWLVYLTLGAIFSSEPALAAPRVCKANVTSAVIQDVRSGSDVLRVRIPVGVLEGASDLPVAKSIGANFELGRACQAVSRFELLQASPYVPPTRRVGNAASCLSALRQAGVGIVCN